MYTSDLFDSILELDVNEYLMEVYPTMNLESRRAIAKYCLDYVDVEELLSNEITMWVNNYAKIQAGYRVIEDFVVTEDEAVEIEEPPSVDYSA